MNPNVEKLHKIAQKESRLILGLMSGTSLDGLDLALCRIKGSGRCTEFTILNFETIAFPADFSEEIKSIFAKEKILFKQLCVLNAKIAISHSSMINEKLKKWGVSASEVDLIASHGQTVFHAPRSQQSSAYVPNSTLQIGDGDHIAVLTNIITVSDFRQKHVAAGGEGAPLVIYGDYLLFSHPKEDRILLNIGGIANFTFLPANQELENLISTDVGPGNTLMNQYMREHFNLNYDKDGIEAAAGTLSIPLLNALIKHPFFNQPYPKTTGPEEFNLDFVSKAKKDSNTENLSHQDSLATLVALTAYGIANAIDAITGNQSKPSVYVSGGGLHNPALMNKIKQELTGFSIQSTDSLGMHPDAKEAVLFAILANETIAGNPIHFPKSTGAPAICMGKISFPN